jgi:hypothetical protein
VWTGKFGPSFTATSIDKVLGYMGTSWGHSLAQYGGTSRSLKFIHNRDAIELGTSSLGNNAVT